MTPTDIIYHAVPIVLAITVHEVAHGWVARLCGDDTAYRQGRLSLNPLRHVDPIGTVLVPGLLLLFGGGFLFGWAKPVPVDVRRLRQRRRDTALVAVAGPFSNLLMIVGWMLALRLGEQSDSIGLNNALISMGEVGIIINAVLMLLNLVPVPPLDGSRVVSSVLPPRFAAQYNRIEPYGLIIVLVLLMTHALDFVFAPAMYAIHRLARAFALAPF
ncbi:MAG: site-2 protease family protein [Gammaproteobacteria bacterium]|nr:site-2 protease family protein [Gammaproteobacteria bacterium]